MPVFLTLTLCALCPPAAVLTNVYDALEDGGFLLFFEMTTVLPTLLWGLDAQCWNFEDEREFGLWVKRERWEQLLVEVGFTQVRARTGFEVRARGWYAASPATL